MLAARGLTLVELMATLVIASILIALAFPSMQDFFESSQTTEHANLLVTDLAYARAEAVKRSVQVIVDSTGGDWKDGWTVSVDIDLDGVGDEDLMVREALQPGFELTALDATTSTAQATVGFDGAGAQSLPGDLVVFSLCRPDADIARSKRVRLEITGRSSAHRGVAAC